MTDRYTLDADDTTGERPTNADGVARERCADGRRAEADDAADAASRRGASDRGHDGGDGRPTGIPIPRDHVGTFVAEAFEDPERDTDWETVVDAVVADEASDAWAALCPGTQVQELLDVAADYDRRAADLLGEIPLHDGDPTERIEALFAEARRRRRNADMIRDGIADAYATGRVEDEALVAAVESSGFDAGHVATREDRLEAVADAYGFDFRPYGGTLFTADGDDDWTSAEATWEVEP